MVLGDFEPYLGVDSSHITILSIFFLVFTILMNIVLMNILIAIISRTFENVSQNEKLANAYERANLIVDYEKFFDEKEKIAMNKDIKQYVCASYSETIHTNANKSDMLGKNIEMDLRTLTNKVNIIDETLRKLITYNNLKNNKL